MVIFCTGAGISTGLHVPDSQRDNELVISTPYKAVLSKSPKTLDIVPSNSPKGDQPDCKDSSDFTAFPP